MITENNIVYHELIGLNVEAQGTKGKVVDETMNMVEIETGSKTRKVMKKNSKFTFTLPSKKKVTVDGNILVARPEDRTRKKVSKW